MSGIVGWIDVRRDISTQSRVLDAMTETLRHRGPDTGGTWLSAHAGLGYRGLTTDPRQPDDAPVHVEVGAATVALVLAGAIYNAPELRSEVEAGGGSLRQGSHGELLLQAFLRWGTRFLEH